MTTVPSAHFSLTFDVSEASAGRVREAVIDAIPESDGILGWRASTVRDGPMPTSLTWPEEPAPPPTPPGA